MKWALLLGSADISGGTYVIFEHTIRAHRRGVACTLVTEKPVTPEQLHWHPEARELTWKTFDEVKDETFDVAMATWWRTVFELPRVSARTYGYFVQSIESRFYPAEERALRQLADATYLVDLPTITEATWIRDHLRATSQEAAQLVFNGIRKDIYTPDGEALAPRQPGKLRVLVEGPLAVPFKNVKRTLELCRRSKADEIWLLSPNDLSTYPGVDRLFSQVPIFETPRLFRSCDVIVKLSYVEGMFGPPLEMFHCGGTAITYDVTGHDEYLRHGQNALVAHRDDEDSVVGFLNQLKADPILLAKLKAGAQKTAQGWRSWDESSREFEVAMGKVAAGPPRDREALRTRLQAYLDFYTLAEDQRHLAEQRTLRAHVKDVLAYRYHLLRQKVGRLRRDLFR